MLQKSKSITNLNTHDSIRTTQLFTKKIYLNEKEN
jgi:hypothetical protein